MFTPNYPIYSSDRTTLLSTPERTGAPFDYTGRGVVIAFIDSGFYPHPDLGDRVLVHADATTGRIVEGRRYGRAMWYSWHGQMTSVIAAGDGRTSGGQYRGIASGAQLVLIKVSTTKGLIKERDILRGMRWLLRNARRFNVRVLNVSVGGDFPSDDPHHPLHRAVHALTRAGITIVCAAGNSGASHLVPPASALDAITVGGLDDQNSLDRGQSLPYANNYGTTYDGMPKPDVIAPAMWIASPILPDTSVQREAHWLAPLLHIAPGDTDAVRNILSEGYGDLAIAHEQAQAPDNTVYDLLQKRINAHKLIDAHHQYVDGTSVAAAIVSSIVAQLLEANPGLTPQRVKAILTSTAWRLPSAPAEQQGYGVIDPAKAVADALS